MTSRILFYVEPLPIRHHSSAFSWIFSRFCSLVSSDLSGQNILGNAGIEVRILASNSMEPALEDFPGLQAMGNILVPEKGGLQERMHSKYSQLPWMQEGFSVWNELLRGEGEVSRDYMNVLTELHASYPFDLIVYWGNNGAVRNLSKLLSIPSIALELGCMRSPFAETFYCDFSGVNGFSSLVQYGIPAYNSDYPLPALNGIGNRGWDQLFWPPSVEASNRPTILVPLQLMDDSNISAFSNFTSMRQFVTKVYEDLRPLNPRLIIKPHPGAKNYPWTQKDHIDCEKFCEKLDNVIWLKDFDNKISYIPLLQSVDGVVTINSSTGYEAMVVGKPVLSYGLGPFTALCFRNATEFMGAIENSNHEQVCQRRSNSLEFLYHYLCDGQTLQSSTRFLYQLNRQIGLSEAAKRGDNAFAQQMRASLSFENSPNSSFGTGLGLAQWL